MIFDNYKNLGWGGGFQTRHVSPVLLVLCIAFGLGAWRLVSTSYQIPKMESSKLFTIGKLTIIIFLFLSVLLANGAGQGAIEHEKHKEATVEPVSKVAQIVNNSSVGVIWPRNQRNIVLYSENEVRPIILYDTNERGMYLQTRHGQTTTRRLVTDPVLCDSDTSYLYLHVETDYIERFPYTVQVNRSRINTLINAHETVYHKHIPESSFRTTRIEIYLLRMKCQ